ncbi:MAG: M23 family metallopeptidase [Geminicoccaceae bacterium]
MRARGFTLIVGLTLAGWPGGAGAQPGQVRLEGELVQGGLVLGAAPSGSQVLLDGRELRVGADGRFVFGFGRDAPDAAELVVRYPDHRLERRTLPIRTREYHIQRIDGLPPRQVTPSQEDFAKIQAEDKLLKDAKRRDSDLNGFAEPAAWPVIGPISGAYGSQRILNGEPRAPHRGVDIAARAGTPVDAMARGVVALAEPDMYFTGNTVMIDHGHGLHSIYCHMSEIDVAVGQAVERGDPVGKVGATGRATGPHLHWGVYWFDKAVDPALLVGPMPALSADG